MRLIKIILLLLIVSCATTKLTEEQKLKQLFTTELTAYGNDFNNKNWNGITDRIYPKFFDFMPKEKMLEMFEEMEKSGMEMTFEVIKLDTVSEVIVHENEKFCKVDYLGKLTMKLSGEMLEMKEMLGNNFKTAFGQENVIFDDKTNSFYINSTKSMLAISPKNESNWKFLEFNKDKTRMLKMLLPKEVIQKLTPEVNIEEPSSQIQEAIEYEEEVLEDDIVMEIPEDSEEPIVEEIFTVIENPAQFPGGESKLHEFITKNLTYPETAKNNNIQGTVYVQFVVEKDGRITGTKVLRGISKNYDEEAIRVVNSMPNWIPGTQRGKKVRFRYNLPVKFKLTEKIEVIEDQIIEDHSPEKIEESAFVVVEKMPNFPGGEEKLYKFISKNLNYPEIAKNNNIQGMVYVQFIVEKDGSLSNTKVFRGIGNGCDQEALRVVKSMPKWSAGTQRGKKVRVKFVLPFNFKLH